MPPGNNTSPSRPSGALQGPPQGWQGRAGCRFFAFPLTERWVYVPLPFNPGFKSISDLLFNVVKKHTHTEYNLHLSHLKCVVQQCSVNSHGCETDLQDFP